MKYGHAILVLAVSLIVCPARGHMVGMHHDHSLSQANALEPTTDHVRELVATYHRNGDDTLLDLGWRMLRSRLEDQPQAEDLLAAAWLAQAQHHFDMAEQYLARVVALRPNHGEAWLLRASVALVGNAVEASREACAATALTVPMVVTAACYARAAAANSGIAETHEAYRRLSLLIAAQPATDDALSGWVHGVAADLAMRAGLPVAAEVHFKRAMELAPSISLRAGYADLLLTTRRPERALVVLAGPSGAPALAVRRLVAQGLLGDGPSPGDLAEIDATFDRWMIEGELQHAREMALFYLKVIPRPEKAWMLAQSNYRVQREPEDLEVLCAAAGRLGQSEPICADRFPGRSLVGWL